jgi:hypothetical protein
MAVIDGPDFENQANAILDGTPVKGVNGSKGITKTILKSFVAIFKELFIAQKNVSVATANSLANYLPKRAAGGGFTNSSISDPDLNFVNFTNQGIQIKDVKIFSLFLNGGLYNVSTILNLRLLGASAEFGMVKVEVYDSAGNINRYILKGKPGVAPYVELVPERLTGGSLLFIDTPVVVVEGSTFIVPVKLKFQNQVWVKIQSYYLSFIDKDPATFNFSGIYFYKNPAFTSTGAFTNVLMANVGRTVNSVAFGFVTTGPFDFNRAFLSDKANVDTFIVDESTAGGDMVVKVNYDIPEDRVYTFINPKYLTSNALYRLTMVGENGAAFAGISGGPGNPVYLNPKRFRAFNTVADVALYNLFEGRVSFFRKGFYLYIV